MSACRYWVGNDTTGHPCNAEATERFSLCEKHFKIEKARTERELERQRARNARVETAWMARTLPRLPQMRVQLEQAEREYQRRTASPVQDRAAVGGAMHASIVRAQASHLSDTNVARVVELDRIITRLRADIARAEADS